LRRQAPHQDSGGVAFNNERNSAPSVLVLRAGSACLPIRGLPRGRLPGLGGSLLFDRELAALTALGTSLTPRFIDPSKTASGSRYGLSAVAGKYS